MNRDDVIRMAREAGIPYDPWPDSAYNKNIELFAALVAAAERKAFPDLTAVINWLEKIQLRSLHKAFTKT